MDALIILNEEQIDVKIYNAVRRSILEIEREKNSISGDRLYSINQVAKRLGKSHATISKLVKLNIIHTTKNGYISESAIEEYLQKK